MASLTSSAPSNSTSPSRKKDDLLQLFDKYGTELSALDAETQSTDHQIDQLVYQPYNLTPEEIAIVEESAK